MLRNRQAKHNNIHLRWLKSVSNRTSTAKSENDMENKKKHRKKRQNSASESIEWSCISSDISMVDASMWFDKYFPIWFLPKRNLSLWRRFKSSVFPCTVQFFFGLLVKNSNWMERRKKTLYHAHFGLDYQCGCSCEIKQNDGYMPMYRMNEDGENFFPEMFCFTSFLFLSFILFFSFFLCSLRWLSHDQKDISHSCRNVFFLIIIANQRMLKVLEKVFFSSPLKNRHCYGQRGFPFIEIPIEVVGSGHCASHPPKCIRIYYVSVDAHSENHILQINIQCLRWWWYEAVNFEFQWGKTLVSTWTEKKNRWQKAKGKWKSFGFTLCAFSFEHM